MTEPQLLEIIIWGAFGIAGWFMKRTVDKLEKDSELLRNEMNTVKSNYLLRSEFKEFKDELRHMFEELKTDIRALRKD